MDFRGFNGAATNWSRKYLRDGVELAEEGSASMGPRPIGRGNPQGGPGARGKVHASMGPRPIGRGNCSAAVALPSRVVLQWGRDQLVAEI